MTNPEIEAIRARVEDAKQKYAGWVTVDDAEKLLQALAEKDLKIAALENISQAQASALECSEHNQEVYRRRCVALEAEQHAKKEAR